MAELANQQGSTFYKDGEFTKYVLDPICKFLTLTPTKRAQERYQAVNKKIRGLGLVLMPDTGYKS